MYLIYTTLRMAKDRNYNGFYKIPIIVFAVIFLLEIWLGLFGEYPCAECGGDVSDVGGLFWFSIPVYIVLNVEYLAVTLIYKDRNPEIKLDKKYIFYFFLFLLGVPIIFFGILFLVTLL